MGFFRRTFELAQAAQELADAAPTFEIGPDEIDPAVFGLETYHSPVAPMPRIDRRSAMQVPAVKRARDLIAGTLGGLPLEMTGPQQRPAADAAISTTLLDQPEKNVPRSVTMTRTFEDLLFEERAWWEILAFGFDDFPMRVRRLPARQVDLNEDTGRVTYRDRHIPDERLIRFDSPTDGLLTAGSRAIRTCLRLEAAGANQADGNPPVDYFTPADGADPAEDEDVEDLLAAWETARKLRQTGYVPAALKYNIAGWSPEQLQMKDRIDQAVVEIARCAGIDPEELGVSTTSRTYQNQQDRRKNFLDFTLGQYRQAVEDRLSMNDVTRRGWSVRFDLSAWLRSDDKTRMETYKVGLEVGAYTEEEIREAERKRPLTASETAKPRPDLKVVNE